MRTVPICEPSRASKSRRTAALILRIKPGYISCQEIDIVRNRDGRIPLQNDRAISIQSCDRMPGRLKRQGNEGVGELSVLGADAQYGDAIFRVNARVVRFGLNNLAIGRNYHRWMELALLVSSPKVAPHNPTVAIFPFAFGLATGTHHYLNLAGCAALVVSNGKPSGMSEHGGGGRAWRPRKALPKTPHRRHLQFPAGRGEDRGLERCGFFTPPLARWDRFSRLRLAANRALRVFRKGWEAMTIPLIELLRHYPIKL